MLEIIPSIELRGGKAIRIQRGPTGTEARVPEDAVKAALRLQTEGATRLHLIDADGERVGTPQNVPLIRDILRKVSIPLQVGGGLRNIMLAERVLNLGVDRIYLEAVVGAQDDRVIREILLSYGSRVVVAADSRDGYVASNGWTARVAEPITEFGKRLVQLGAQRFLFTDVARADTLNGVNAEAASAFAQAVGVPVQVAGGVGGPEDISLLAKVAQAQPNGIEGVILGKVLYSGHLTLVDALSRAREQEN
jgi:phosphoribosylformimino-5-aminoimidazole carboxamide ribotide isomerase